MTARREVPESAARETDAPRAVVIGGGIAGLATAVLLAREGYEVRLLERNESLGGRAATLTRDGFRFELGPSWYLMPAAFEHFFRLAGTSTDEQLDLVTLDPAYRVFPEPRGGDREPPLTVPLGAERVRQSFDRLEPGGGAVLQRYLASASEAAELAERYFLYNPFTSLRSLLDRRLLRRLPRVLGLLFTPLDRFVAARFAHPVLRQVLGYPAVFLGTSPSAAPAVYHLMSELDLGEGVRYPMGGFASVVASLERLATAAGVTITTSAEAEEILTERPGAAVGAGRFRRPRLRPGVAGVRWRDSSGATSVAQADVVVSAADLHHTETELLPPALRSYPERWWTRRVSGPGAILVLLGVRGELPELPHHSLFFVRDWAENFDAIFGGDPRIPEPASIYVCKPSATDPDVAPVGHENLFVLVPVPADRSIGEETVQAGGDRAPDPRLAEVADAVVDQIERWAGVPGLRERIVTRTVLGPADFVREYHSWRGGMLGPAHTLRQSAMFRAQNESRRVSGLFYAGATTAPGVGVPMCLISAELVLKRIRGDRSPGPLPE